MKMGRIRIVKLQTRSILSHSNSKSEDLDQEVILFSLCHHPPRKLFYRQCLGAPNQYRLTFNYEDSRLCGRESS